MATKPFILAVMMNDILNQIDLEIERLQQARKLLSGTSDATSTGKRRGRPKGSFNKPAAPDKPAKRKMSPEGKAKIAAAQKARWAAARKSTK